MSVARNAAGPHTSNSHMPSPALGNSFKSLTRASRGIGSSSAVVSIFTEATHEVFATIVDAGVIATGANGGRADR